MLHDEAQCQAADGEDAYLNAIVWLRLRAPLRGIEPCTLVGLIPNNLLASSYSSPGIALY